MTDSQDCCLVSSSKRTAPTVDRRNVSRHRVFKINHNIKEQLTPNRIWHSAVQKGARQTETDLPWLKNAGKLRRLGLPTLQQLPQSPVHTVREYGSGLVWSVICRATEPNYLNPALNEGQHRFDGESRRRTEVLGRGQRALKCFLKKKK